MKKIIFLMITTILLISSIVLGYEKSDFLRFRIGDYVGSCGTNTKCRMCFDVIKSKDFTEQESEWKNYITDVETKSQDFSDKISNFNRYEKIIYDEDEVIDYEKKQIELSYNCMHSIKQNVNIKLVECNEILSNKSVKTHFNHSYTRVDSGTKTIFWNETVDDLDRSITKKVKKEKKSNLNSLQLRDRLLNMPVGTNTIICLEGNVQFGEKVDVYPEVFGYKYTEYAIWEGNVINDNLNDLSNINETLSSGLRHLYGRIEGRSAIVLYDKVDCNLNLVGYKHGKRGTWSNGVLGCGFKEIKDALYMNSTGAPTGAGGSMFIWVDSMNISNINNRQGVTIEISNYDDLYTTMHKYAAVRSGNLGWFNSPNTSTNGQWEALGEGTSGKSLYFGTNKGASSQITVVVTRDDTLLTQDYTSAENPNTNIPITYVTWLNTTHFNFTRNGTVLKVTSARTYTSIDGWFILYIGGTNSINVAHYIFNYTIYNGTSWSYSNYSLVSRMFNASNTQNISYTISYANITWYGDMDGFSLNCSMRTGTTVWQTCSNNTNVYLNGLYGIQFNLTAATTDPHRIPKIDRYVLAIKIANYTQDTPVNDSESANTGIEEGIRGSLHDSKIYTNQLVYVRTKANQHALARFDKVGVYGSQRWGFNYILPNEVSIGTFYNITPSFYFLEMQNITYWNITARVGQLINATKS